ncbi:beta-ketoacyl synthase N-terminal-like domain-containing protein [Buchnera aphidicola]|uniref:3-oxoacyl-[acyl-carrier-protein] synthase 1 n=1 Tax=Buchnera aphidicola subsp. Cinara cedri (strain Cc) TaxID=372461 RepID=Q058B5_BUCCC|nr:beta-ketoacyl synthase N-terminal-like domain-containing protein [Buchnera aphidicola]ABJ90534.1 3-oxoacyl-(acyl-carrier-protein) synthase I [Buchnera aphidicola BCc]
MKRIVITGFGILSSLGSSEKNIFKSLKYGLSGIEFSQEMKNYGLYSTVWGNISKKKISKIPRKYLRFMNLASIYSYLSMKDAITSSNLDTEIFMKNPRVGIIIGSGSGSTQFYKSIFKRIHNNSNYLSPYAAIQNMSSSISACLGSFFKIYGMSYSVSSACATSAHCIAHAYELLTTGKQDIIFAGGAEELSVELACQFDAMKILSSKFNNTPELSSRAFDKYRDGFVISGGSGILVLEELNFALSRNANIYAEIIGYGTSCDGNSITLPSGDGFIRCMRNALKNITESVDYINAHSTSTQIGDIKELMAIKKVFKKYDYLPYISSTKSITGHSLGASGVQEIIYTILMLKYGFIAPSINIECLDERIYNMNIVKNRINKIINIAISNSFGFGGTNVCLVIKRFNRY